jgi:hypothetical protein
MIKLLDHQEQPQQHAALVQQAVFHTVNK